MNKEEYRQKSAELVKIREEALRVARDFVDLADKKIAQKISGELRGNNMPTARQSGVTG